VATQEVRKAEYLEKAKEAEELAEKTKDPQVRDSWLKIAQSYRELARTTGFKI
jgi:hypothetical protein